MIDELFAKFEGAFAENTIRGYRHDFEQFSKWCANESIHPLPAPSIIIAAHIDALSETHKAASIRRRINALSTIYRLGRMEDTTKDPDVTLAMKRMHRKLGRAQKQAKPLTKLYLDKMIEAQEKLTSINNDMYRLKGYRPKPASAAPTPQEAPPQRQPAVPELTPRQKEWLSDNDWYGKDRHMTAFALAVHEELVYNGVDPNSEKYYSEVNRQVRQRFADKFSTDDSDEEFEVAPKKKASVVAPATRSSKNPKRIKLTQTQIDLSKRLGITPEQYAAQLLKEQQNG